MFKLPKRTQIDVNLEEQKHQKQQKRKSLKEEHKTEFGEENVFNDKDQIDVIATTKDKK